MSVAALFVRKDSIYKSMPGVDAWDEARDARRYFGRDPVIAHPPCAQWGCLSHMSTDNPVQKDLAHFAVDIVRLCGGVLEHPKDSKLWAARALPAPGAEPDRFGGWTLAVSQKWWGHRAEKKTLLYIVGCKPQAIPPMPITLGHAPMVCGQAGRRKNRTRCMDRPELPKAERERSPPAFAACLVELAAKCRR